MTPTTALIDTGPLVSILRSSQPHHRACVDTLKTLGQPLLTCLPVFTEAAYLLRHRPEQVHALLTGVETGFLQLLPLEASDVLRARDILHLYADQGFDFADACLMHLAEREGISTVFTLDSDFQIYRPQKNISIATVPVLTT